MAKWSEAVSVIAKLAPSIGAAVGGPLAGSAITALEGALGVKPVDPALTARQDAIALAVSTASAQQLADLQKANLDFKAKMTQLGFENDQAIAAMAVQDRASARDREVKLKDWTPSVLSACVTIGFFGILGYMMKFDVPSNSRETVNVMLGSLGTAWLSIICYYFGSSSGSDRKTELLSQAGPVK